MLQDRADKHTFRMATKRMRKCYKTLNAAFIFCLLAVCFQGVICKEVDVDADQTNHGDGVLPNPTTKGQNKGDPQVPVYPTISPDSGTSETPGDRETTQPTQFMKYPTNQQNTQTSDQTDSNTPETKGNVVCVDKIPVRFKYDVLLKLKASSTCEETKARIQSVIEHLCGEDCKLEIYQKDNTDEINVYGDSIEADPEGMAGKFNNDNITDKVEVEEAVSRMGQRSKMVLISMLICGLLLAALLISGYLLKTHRGHSKGLRLAEESFQVDQDNQGNTLLSVTPLPQQEPVDKPIINGESPESPPTNGHSANQTQVADTQM
ncbi:hematopoietic progenitor cell antigen CD34-like [Myxocyprinus asiaticus]|uniref:hematopoietic progenitor cell antigen CD34-like n=1 Tax=Myxocyprinus asiaticus TaxID=70543 RepID=UPI00222225E6|nr:hematopoietic progenitor cell antigen CD34-like [Myxocyprinus asiaticus]